MDALHSTFSLAMFMVSEVVLQSNAIELGSLERRSIKF